MIQSIIEVAASTSGLVANSIGGRLKSFIQYSLHCVNSATLDMRVFRNMRLLLKSYVGVSSQM